MTINHIHKNAPPNFYDQGMAVNIFQHYWHTKRIKIIKKIISSFKNFKGEVLDLGCHGGMLTNKISELNPQNKIYGVDISKKAIVYAKNRYPHINFIVYNLQNGIPYSDNKFRLITCFDVLEHIFNLDKLVKECKRVLKNNGYLLIGIPHETIFFKFVWFIWTKFLKGRVWRDTHIHHFNKQKLNSLFEPEGFEKVFEKKTLFNMWWIIMYEKINLNF